ncbi:tannase/feruloyl esterase [Pseudoduganella lurida]|uniref:Tannase/feruloyl esterase n=1 Tax=Pseudoduganella lurida TaxID=1036180 RepID=A0A562R0D7_9BURK|nr:tannase/feruloyl esterase family alpha/beta hydrolase [Pseudoduganella lurida]TWI62529.1 tannase/feruloyl esterase [Pseudoduganella lurida]
MQFRSLVLPLAGAGFMMAALPASAGAAPVLSCDETLKSSFATDADTSVVLVKAFRKGEPLSLPGSPASKPGKPADNDVCLVKLVVGPGNRGPANATSTSRGIGIEVWLPARANWNGRVHALGGGGWQGGKAAATDAIASPDAAAIAGGEGAVSSVTDTGHTVGGGSFAMLPDGGINERLWIDFASRAIHEQALKTKALATAYYGAAPRRSYWEGGSTGGRQGLKLAQRHPDDFDGIIANFPALNWTRFITSEMYPQIVFQRDLKGKPLSLAQMDLASNAAIRACDVVGGHHLGYLLDPSICTYDPAKDAAVLCRADGGSNNTPDCLSKTQANAINKIWYGMTADGTVPAPVADNGWKDAESATLPGTGNHKWFGLPRGTSLYAKTFYDMGLDGLASPRGPFLIASDLLALELQDPTIAGPNFVNAEGTGQGRWKQLSYAQLAGAYERGLALQSKFGEINTDSPDLSAFKARGGKMLTWHGLNDEAIAPQGTINYYNRVAANMGGVANVQDFYRLYLVPGLGHGTPNGTANPAASPPNFAPTQMYELLTAWVEHGVAPADVTLRSSGGGVTRTRPICVYPQRVQYTGGNPDLATSYICS